jgi:hypothetical protein
MAAGFAIRLVVWFAYKPAIDPDTASYVELASRIRSLNFSGWDGGRTPMYPLLILFSGLNFDALRLFQGLLGIATAALLTLLVYGRTGNSMLAGLGGLLFALNLGQVSFESTFLSESLCTFFLVGSILIFRRIWTRKTFRWGEMAALSATAGVTALTRPMFAFLAPLYFVFLATSGRRSSLSLNERSKALAAFAAPAAVLLLGWCLVNWYTVGYFSLDTIVGFGLSNQSGEFIGLAPDKYAAIRDPYMRAAARQAAETGSHFEPIFDAAPEIYRRTGWNEVQLSRELTRMSIELFVAHPLLYAKGVARAWLGFWSPGAYWLRDHFSGPVSWETVFGAWSLQKPVYTGLNILFVLIAAWALTSVFRGRGYCSFDLCMISLVLTASLVQAMMELGENSRYSVPTFPVVVYVVLAWVSKMNAETRAPRMPL